MTNVTYSSKKGYYIIQDPTKVWLTSDTHYGHANIIKLNPETRNFPNIATMDDDLIRLHNELVSPEDTVVHLGDFSWLGQKETINYFSKLHGHYYVLGHPFHHDKRWLPQSPFMWGESGVYYTTGVLKVTIVPPEISLRISLPQSNPIFDKFPYQFAHCSHYPIAWWDRRHYGGIHLHGHSHGKCGNDYGQGQSLPGRIDAGIDVWGKPVRLDVLLGLVVKSEDIKVNDKGELLFLT